MFFGDNSHKYFIFYSLRQQQSIAKCKIPMVNQHTMQTNDPSFTNVSALPMKHSMLDKLKFFNKEKMDRSSKIHIAKHTSSSSGISSARSEHSDSSISLNDGVGSQSTSRASSVPAPGNHSKKPEIPSAKSKHKMLAMAPKSGSRDALNSKKFDKKERSTEMLCDKKTPRTHQPKSIAESKLKMTTSTKSASPIPVSGPKATVAIQVTNVPTITSIPKPMAAIKGTTKPALAPQKSVQNVVDVKDVASISSAKQIISNSPDRTNTTATNSNNSNNNELVNQTNPMHNHHHHHHQEQQQQQQKLSQQNLSLMNESIHSKSTYVSSSTGPISTASSCESISTRNATVPRSNKFPMSNHRKMPAIDGMDLPNGMNRVPSNRSIASSQSTASSDGHKYMTEPSKLMHSINDIIYEDEKPKTISPMRPMFRGYSSHLTFPTRNDMRGQHRTIQEYNDEIAQGYCSESDTMRKPSVRYTDIENGYMSEGGGRTMINGNMNKHHKIFVGLMKARAQLPATIEER